MILLINIYRLMTSEVGYALPSIQCVTTYFLKDIMAKRKKCFKGN